MVQELQGDSASAARHKVGKARAALRVNGKVAVGHCHLDAMSRIDWGEGQVLESGWIDEAGEFHSTVDTALESSSLRGCILIRHAESEGNAGATENPDPGLTEAGRRTLPGLANFVGCVANGGRHGLGSPMLRCLLTARAIEEAVPNVHFRVVPRLSAANPEYMIQDRRNEFGLFDWPEQCGPWPANDSTYCDDELRWIIDEMAHGAVVVTHSSWIWNLIWEMGRCRHEMSSTDDVPNSSVSLMVVGKGCNCRFRRVSESGALLA